jgi:hypothetical protein
VKIGIQPGADDSSARPPFNQVNERADVLWFVNIGAIIALFSLRKMCSMKAPRGMGIGLQLSAPAFSCVNEIGKG